MDGKTGGYVAEPAFAGAELQHENRPDRAVRPEGYEALVGTTSEGLHRLAVMVEGAHCAACISKIESRLAKEQDIRTARLNFTTHRLSMEWQGAPGRANDFAAAVESLGYKVHPFEHQKTESEEDKFLLLCLGVAGFAMGNIMLLSVGLWTSSQAAMGVETRDFLHWMSAIIALPAIIFSGRPFFRSAFRALSSGTTNMDVPISVALVLTSLMSLFETVRHGEHAYFDSVVMLMFFLLVGRYLDSRARRQARGAAGELLGAVTGFADVVEEDGTHRRLPVSALQPGMILRVAAGEKIPADGVIADGETAIDMALVTGETLPAEARAGSPVYTGTINLSAPVTMRVIKTADDTLLSEIIRLMEKAEQVQAKYVLIADRIARAYTPVVHILAAAAFTGWFVAGLAWQDALLIAATVLIITCPCALALAVPVVQVLATGKLFRSGILVKSGDALERLAAIDILLLDKTGTLTLGHPELEAEHDPGILQLGASLASYSAHPLSRALVRGYGGPLLSFADVREFPGLGLEARYNGKAIRLGRRDWCGLQEHQGGRMEICLFVEDLPPQVFYFSDRLRGDACETIRELKARGLDIILISGDRDQPVAEMARSAGIEKFYASMTPVEKFTLLEKLKKSGKKILMAGDGLNDAPSLAGADVSISPATASGLAQNTADIVFMGEGLKPLLISYDTAVLSQKLVKQNFALAVLYNIFAIPMAMAGFVTPLVAALAMSGSSLVVIANSFRLRGVA
ncbi:MAG: cadmium-translocating P-type ATPase [Alphaproteobacteria bacterium]|nr:cadmium-translocating P-type ATPase [Alphaproteobacteria bacterium]